MKETNIRNHRVPRYGVPSLIRSIAVLVLALAIMPGRAQNFTMLKVSASSPISPDIHRIQRWFRARTGHFMGRLTTVKARSPARSTKSSPTATASPC